MPLPVVEFGVKYIFNVCCLKAVAPTLQVTRLPCSLATRGAPGADRQLPFPPHFPQTLTPLPHVIAAALMAWEVVAKWATARSAGARAAHGGLGGARRKPPARSLGTP